MCKVCYRGVKMGKKGIFGLSFTTAFGILAALFIGVGVFAIAPALIGQLSDYANRLAGTINQSVDQYEQIARDSAEGVRIGLSCTALMNAQNRDSSTDHITYLENEWESWEDGVCQEAASGSGVKVGELERVSVECDSPGFGEAGGGGSCEVYNFELPNGFQEEDDIKSAAVNWLQAQGDPKYVLYYNAFPDYGVEEDWESRLTGQYGVMTGQFLFRVTLAASIGGLTEGVPALTKADNFLDTMDNFFAKFDVSPGTKIRRVVTTVGDWMPLVKTTAEAQEEVYTRMVQEGMEGVSRDAVQDSMEEIIEQAGVSPLHARDLVENDEAFEALKREIMAGIQDSGASRFAGEVADNGVDSLSRESYEEVTTRIRSVVDDYGDFEELSDEGVDVVFRSFMSEMGDEGLQGMVRSVDEGLDLARSAGVSDKYYYEAISEAQASSSNFFRAVDNGDDTALRELFEGEVESLEQMKRVLSSEGISDRVDNYKAIACGSGIYRRMVASQAGLDILDSTDLMENEAIKNSALVARCTAATQGGSFCGTSATQGTGQTAACVTATLMSQAGAKEAAKNIKKEPIGINSLGLKRPGLQEPVEYELHPVANWYFTSLEPKGWDDETNAITGAGNRFYFVSPCRIESGDEENPANLEITHTQESCYKVPGDRGIKMAANDFAWGDYTEGSDGGSGFSEGDYEFESGNVENTEMFEHLHRMGRDTVPADVFLLGMQGSYFYNDEGENTVSNFISEIFGDSSDLVYTEHPFVWNKPYEWESAETVLMNDVPSGYGKIIDTGEDIGRSQTCERFDKDKYGSTDDLPDYVDEQDVTEDDGSFVYCSGTMEGWYSQTMVEQPSNTEAPSYNGMEPGEIRQRIKDIHENIRVLDDMKQQQFLREIDKETVFDGEDYRYSTSYSSTDFMNTVWDTARTLESADRCDDPDVREKVTKLFRCETGSPVIDGQSKSMDAGASCDGGDGEPELRMFEGGEIITWNDYCTSYVGNVSKLREMYMGEDGDRMYYSQIGYWLPADQGMERHISNIEELVRKKGEQLDETENEEKVVDIYFMTQYNVGLFRGEDEEDRRYMFGDPEWAWSNVVLEDRQNLVGNEQYFREYCTDKEEEIKAEGNYRWKYPVCELGEFKEGFSGNPFCGMQDIADEIKQKFREENDVTGNLAVFTPGFLIQDSFKMKCADNPWYMPERQGCYLVPKDISLTSALSGDNITFYRYEDVDGNGEYDGEEDNIEEEYQVDAAQYLKDILGEDAQVIGDAFRMEPFLGGEVISFDRYCRDYLSNLTEIEKKGVDYDINEDTTISMGEGNNVVPSIPERYMTASGNGKKICQQQSVAADIKQAVNPLDSKVNQEVDTLQVKVGDNTDLSGNNYCYSSTSVVNLGLKGVIMVTAATAESTAWGAAAATGGIGVPGAVIAQVGISFLENYLWMRLSQTSQWPKGGVKDMEDFGLDKEGIFRDILGMGMGLMKMGWNIAV